MTRLHREVAQRVTELTPNVTDKDWTASYSDIKRVYSVGDPKLPFLLNIRIFLESFKREPTLHGSGSRWQGVAEGFRFLFYKDLHDNNPDATIGEDIYYWIEHAVSASAWSPNISKQFARFLEEEARLIDSNPDYEQNEKLIPLLESLRDKEVFSTRLTITPESSVLRELKYFFEALFHRNKRSKNLRDKKEV